jgi:ribose 5-phosphate isomerase RpiB
VRRSYGFACTAAGFSIAGQGAGFSRSLGRISEVVAFGLAGMTASARLARRLSAGAGVFALGGQAVAGGAHPTASPLYATELGIQLGF